MSGDRIVILSESGVTETVALDLASALVIARQAASHGMVAMFVATGVPVLGSQVVSDGQ
jgi:hypothetical protein